MAPLLSTTFLIAFTATANLIVAYYFLTSPITVAHQGTIFILGEAMGMPQAPSFLQPTATSAFVAAALALVSIQDLVGTLTPERIASFYWNAQAPIRFFFFLIVSLYSYMSRPKDPDFAGLATLGRENRPMAEGGLSSGPLFSWAFFQMLIWFWILITARDERREFMAKEARREMAKRDGIL
ncbi:hypothetical protein MMC14_001900 [Varicellaria rhodocarpa]|nr:hypothetical protein [Varicellaria rhodocarpa]